ncbi:hypothetical protein [Nesterenkonia sandarakina]|uniref:Uncharacterized protein n=1 Tax=Nesterenkonia sandarakina TaxID=272918 RepID=A0A7Z0J2D7_9MICC|nr:hypothetical protein [Nesterenkonia sandarakina]NYJ16145.1 hypothetical protein [Nesterenkonia sandarakina]
MNHPAPATPLRTSTAAVSAVPDTADAELARAAEAAHSLPELPDQRYSQMAKAASTGLMAHQHVDSAIVEISGTAGDLVFHLQCALVPGSESSSVMELITHGVVPNIERMLGEAFTSRDLHFSFAPAS